jgi:hypothetical protein
MPSDGESNWDDGRGRPKAGLPHFLKAYIFFSRKKFQNKEHVTHIIDP